MSFSDCERKRLYRLNAVLPALGKMNPRSLRFRKHRDLRKRVLESFRLKDTITLVESEGYSKDAEPKDSVDQDSARGWGNAGVAAARSVRCGGVLDAEFFSQQCALFLKPVVLC